MTKSNLTKKNNKKIFNKIKYEGEDKYGPFTNARLHVYNNNIVSIPPSIIENLNYQHNYCLLDKSIYGKIWVNYNLSKLNKTSLHKISNLILYDRW